MGKRERARALVARAKAGEMGPRPSDAENMQRIMERTFGELEEFPEGKLVRTMALMDDPVVAEQIMGDTFARDAQGSTAAMRVLREAVEDELRARGLDPVALRAGRTPGPRARVLDGSAQARALRELADG